MIQQWRTRRDNLIYALAVAAARGATERLALRVGVPGEDRLHARIVFDHLVPVVAGVVRRHLDDDLGAVGHRQHRRLVLGEVAPVDRRVRQREVRRPEVRGGAGRRVRP